MRTSNKSYKGGIVIRKILSIFLCIFILINFGTTSFAATITNPKIVKIGEAEKHLKYFREDRGYSTYVVCSIVGFYENNIFYPAYCMNKALPGAENGEYNVNIKDVLNNPKVWRIVRNGYPYLTANQMGLESDFDAFAVTKFAIYCVLGESKLEYYSADSSDLRGQKMLEVLRNLVNIGLNGKDTINSCNMSFEKVKGILENSNYYFLEYKIKSDIGVKSYTVTLNKFPEGTICTDINNNIKNTFLSNENLRIQIPKSKFNSNINGEIEASVKCKNYPVFYGEAPSGKQDYIVTYDTYGDFKFKSNVNINTNTGKLKVIKQDNDFKNPISNVKFELISKDGKYKYNGTTDVNGIVTFNNLYPGKYTLKETFVENKYQILTENIDLEIKYNETKEIKVTNELKKGNLKIVKKDKDFDTPIEGVKFNLISEDEKFKYEGITNEEGIAIFENLYPGKYILKEIETKEEYEILEEEIEVEIVHSKTQELEITNELKKGNLKIVKKDKDFDTPIEGVKFELISEDGKFAYEGITNEEGIVNFENIYPGKYILKEIEVKEEYKLLEEEIEVEIVHSKTQELEITNELKKGNLKIIKEDKENKKLEGVEFELYNESMFLLEKLITKENGEAISKFYSSENKIYFLKEVKTKDGYILNDEIIKLSLASNETFEIKIENEKVPEEPKEIVPEIEIEVPEEILEEPEPIVEIEEPKPIVDVPVPKLPRTGY